MWSKPNFEIFISYGDISYSLKVLNFPPNMTFLVIFNYIFSHWKLFVFIHIIFMTDVLPLRRNYVLNMKLV